jgi:hypothetical protein
LPGVPAAYSPSVPPWTLRICAVLIGIYGLVWAGVAWTGFQVLIAPSGPGPVVNPGALATVKVYGLIALGLGVIATPSLLALALFLWRGSREAVALTVVPTLAIAAALLLVLAGEALQVVVHHGPLDWQLTLWTVGLLVAGPGLVLGLLLAPSSLRIWRKEALAQRFSR